MFQQISFTAVPISSFCGGGNVQATIANQLVSAIRQICHQPSSYEPLRQEDGLCFVK